MKDESTQDDENGKVFGFDLTIRNLLIVIICLVATFIIAIALFFVFYKQSVDTLNKMYMEQTRQIVNSQKGVDEANSWERLPVQERKEKLRGKFHEIFEYYTTDVPQNQKMSNQQLDDAFEVYYTAISATPSVNFFLPLAFWKVKTNFNPTFFDNYQVGINGFYSKEGADVANLPLNKDNPAFQVAYHGAETLQNPSEAMKLMVARVDDLMRTFNNREDWVILALLNHSEYDIIAKYWNNGTGSIPANNYKTGPMADVLRFYYAFKDWTIPSK
jgi:hypothetical protein